jgi:hypothetical protein
VMEIHEVSTGESHEVRARACEFLQLQAPCLSPQRHPSAMSSTVQSAARGLEQEVVDSSCLKGKGALLNKWESSRTTTGSASPSLSWGSSSQGSVEEDEGALSTSDELAMLHKGLDASIKACCGGRYATEIPLSGIDCSIRFGSIGASVTAALERVNAGQTQLQLRKEFGGLTGKYEPNFGRYGYQSVAELRQEEESVKQAAEKEVTVHLEKSLSMLDRDILSQSPPRAFGDQEESALHQRNVSLLKEQLAALDFSDLYQR